MPSAVKLWQIEKENNLLQRGLWNIDNHLQQTHKHKKEPFVTNDYITWQHHVTRSHDKSKSFITKPDHSGLVDPSVKRLHHDILALYVGMTVVFTENKHTGRVIFLWSVGLFMIMKNVERNKLSWHITEYRFPERWGVQHNIWCTRSLWPNCERGLETNCWVVNLESSLS